MQALIVEDIFNWNELASFRFPTALLNGFPNVIIQGQRQHMRQLWLMFNEMLSKLAQTLHERLPHDPGYGLAIALDLDMLIFVESQLNELGEILSGLMCGYSRHDVCNKNNICPTLGQQAFFFYEVGCVLHQVSLLHRPKLLLCNVLNQSTNSSLFGILFSNC